MTKPHIIVEKDSQISLLQCFPNSQITQLKIDNNPFAKGFRSPFSRCRTRHNSSQRYVGGLQGVC